MVTIIRPSTKILTPGSYGVQVMQPAAAAANWWQLMSGVTAAYQPLGAADQASSYIDLTGNGNTATLTTGSVSWSAANGWYGTGWILSSTVVPIKNNFTIIVKWGYLGSGGSWGTLIEAINTGYPIELAGYHTASSRRRYYKGAFWDAATNSYSGVIGIAGDSGWYNGSKEVAAIGTGWGNSTKPLGIGSSTFSDGLAIHAVLVAANASASDGEMAAIMTAMAAF